MPDIVGLNSTDFVDFWASDKSHFKEEKGEVNAVRSMMNLLQYYGITPRYIIVREDNDEEDLD